MTNSQKVKLMAGNKVDKMNLFNFFIDKMKDGTPLDESELPMFEFVKNELVGSSGPVVVDMSATMAGVGGVV